MSYDKYGLPPMDPPSLDLGSMKKKFKDFRECHLDIGLYGHPSNPNQSSEKNLPIQGHEVRKV